MAKVGEYGLDDAHLDGAAPRTPHSRPPAGLGPERVHLGIVRQPGARSLVVRALHAQAQDREERALPGQHSRLGQPHVNGSSLAAYFEHRLAVLLAAEPRIAIIEVDPAIDTVDEELTCRT